MIADVPVHPRHPRDGFDGLVQADETGRRLVDKGHRAIGR